MSKSSREDPMFSLLSSVGGIDSTRFQKPQAMKDQKEERASPGDKNIEALHETTKNPSRAYPSTKESSLPGRNAQTSQVSMRKTSQATSNQSVSRGNANKQLDMLLDGNFLHNKRSRPMRESVKEVPLTAGPLHNDVPGKKGATLVPHDDLDAVFASDPRPSDRSQQAAGLSDPFDLFGGLGSTAQAVTENRPEADTDLLISTSDMQDSAVPSSWGRDSSQHQDKKTDDDLWGSMTRPASSNDKVSNASPSLSEQIRDAGRERGLATRQGPGKSSSQHSMGAPPAYESVVRSPGSSRIASPLSSRVSSPRSGGRISSPKGTKFQAFHSSDEEEVPQNEAHRKQASHRRVQSLHPQERSQTRVGSERQDQAQREGDVRDQAKQWLSAGRDWLSGASKKVAQAVKETQAQINNKLEELDSRHSQGEQATSPQRAGGGVNEWKRASQGVRSRKASSQDVNDIPKYYFEWAATIEALPSNEQSTTLAAMPDEDASNIRRILASKARRQSAELTEEAMLSAAKQRSLREGQAAPTHRQARVPEGTAPRSLSSDLEPTSGEALPSSAARRSQSRPQSASRQLAAEQRTSARAPAAAEATADLMGFHQQEADRPAPGGPPPREQRPQNHGSDDLMGLHSSSNVTGQQRGRPDLEEELDMLGISEAGSRDVPLGAAGSAAFFSPAPAAAPSRPAVSPDIEAMFGDALDHAQNQGVARGERSRGDSMIDFGDEPAAAQGMHDYYDKGGYNEEQAGEPEERKIARRKRLAAQQARIQKQLQEKIDRDQAEEQKQQAQQDHRSVHRQRIEAWKSGKKENIRALLSTLHTILWENSGWTSPGMTDLVEPSKVKRCYMKANLVVHPDKVKQKGGSVEQIVIADMAFDALKFAWSKFEATELVRR